MYRTLACYIPDFSISCCITLKRKLHMDGIQIAQWVNKYDTFNLVMNKL